MVSTNVWNVAAVPWRPSGIIVNWKRPFGVAKAIFSLSAEQRGTCHYPFVRSSVLIYEASPSWLSKMSAQGIRYASKVAILFTSLKLMQNRMLPSGLGTRMIGLHQALGEVSMTPSCTISCTS